MLANQGNNMELAYGTVSATDASEQPMARDAGQPDQPSIRFEALEPRALLSGDVNPSAIAINGTLDKPGQQNTYQFTVQDTHRVVLDSLSNRSDIRWTLTGPSEEIASSLFSSDTGGNVPAFDLPPGTYTLTISGIDDAVGAYA